MKAVMNLAFGRKESRSIDEVYRLANLRSKKANPRSQRLLDPDRRKKLREEFRRPVVSHDVIKAILLKPSESVLNVLVDVASQGSYPSAGRHAASFALQRLMHLDDPPVDPESAKPISRRRAKILRRMIENRFK